MEAWATKRLPTLPLAANALALAAWASCGCGSKVVAAHLVHPIGACPGTEQCSWHHHLAILRRYWKKFPRSHGPWLSHGEKVHPCEKTGETSTARSSSSISLMLSSAMSSAKTRVPRRGCHCLRVCRCLLAAAPGSRFGLAKAETTRRVMTRGTFRNTSP